MTARPAAPDPWHARVGVVLAGGRATRVDGEDKAMFEVDGVPLLAAAVTALSACDEILIVGPRAGRPRFDDVRWIREDPPFAGPVAALSCALAHTGAAELLVLPADLPGASDAVALLLDADLGENGEGVVLVDDSGIPQWLTARYRTAALSAAIASADWASVRGVATRLRLRQLPAPASATRDVDTWDDLRLATKSV
ncbi:MULTISPECIES: molybdenum cofactor guanylyltransferase [unclassified Microbacterium]|uniref:molybdenum cofactor guanylyltransferase n=1 Tax=unclassified Microbacterium TaxID=2609290 RepID=UPI000EA9087A|nr:MULTISPECIES: NTP transferase domain-containing protein [unclassified Microbacterium]MBT2483301.1 NTP transferase domain-containing protein [Microbacterium sp. ISL-108]RKN66339.1 molybdopterin-guanine dinucleotide biosynthesis protein [Microbacterium sp. CGR2]